LRDVTKVEDPQKNVYFTFVRSFEIEGPYKSGRSQKRVSFTFVRSFKFEVPYKGGRSHKKYPSLLQGPSNLKSSLHRTRNSFSALSRFQGPPLGLLPWQGSQILEEPQNYYYLMLKSGSDDPYHS
jgi:hypothetical protein